MRLFFTIFTVLGLVSIKAHAQAIDRSLVAEGLTESTARENVYVHYNTSLLFPGEYFLYSVYNLKNGSGEASNFSKIAYVEMIGEDGTVVFRQKVKLENGQGHADFFLPTSTPSGNYKLIGYTNWMKNLKNAFFEGDLVVINPYQSNQKKLLEADESEGSSITTRSSSPQKQSERTLFRLDLNKNDFEKREKVQIKLAGAGPDASNGRYSLSVRKTGKLPVPEKVYPGEAISLNTSSSEVKTGDNLYLPELRGLLVSGRITFENSVPVSNRKVALSIPSAEGFVQVALTNSQGQFFFNLEKDLRDEKAILEIIGDTDNEFQFELDQVQRLDPGEFSFGEYTITSEMEEEILERSLYNQIENAYFSVKPDTLAPAKEEVVFPASIVETYHLDDYTRFKDVPETFVEIIKSAWVKREGRDNRVFEVRGLLGHLPMRLKPLVMVDGILVQDHSALVNYDARRIETIKIIRDKIYLGPEIFQGAILVKTIEGDFADTYTVPNSKRIELLHPEVSKRYFRQVYNEESRDSRIPDYRYQLLWNPSLEIKGSGQKAEFFTSDVAGDFEVVLEGFTASGKAVSIRKVFTVE